jgi:hypothetical protein
MKLTILSDTHDNLWALKSAMPQIATADAAIHCGDLCSPFMLKELGQGMNGKPAHVVWGNNEGDILLMTRVAAQFPNLTLHGAFAELEFDGVRVAVNHYPDIARGLAASGKYDLVCFGHNHIASLTKVGVGSALPQCQLLNPGEMMGMMGPRTFAFFDTATRAVEFVNVA